MISGVAPGIRRLDINTARMHRMRASNMSMTEFKIKHNYSPFLFCFLYQTFNCEPSSKTGLFGWIGSNLFGLFRNYLITKNHETNGRCYLNKYLLKIMASTLEKVTGSKVFLFMSCFVLSP